LLNTSQNYLKTSSQPFFCTDSSMYEIT
jgi:hypothetical protein